MANIKALDNLWVEFYNDPTESGGYYIESIYVGSDPDRNNIYDYLSESALDFINNQIIKDLELRKAWA